MKNKKMGLDDIENIHKLYVNGWSHSSIAMRDIGKVINAVVFN
ncbi:MULTISPECIES: hypothetical protein [Bacillus cereus group]|nr:hypothetical protein [Bacillus thuringiensis]